MRREVEKFSGDSIKEFWAPSRLSEVNITNFFIIMTFDSGVSQIA